MRDGNKSERDRLSVITRELEAMSDWELERGLCSLPRLRTTTEGWWLIAS